MHKIIVITGPTAVGKTKLSIELAKKYDGEIINADAVQVYKGLDIGSAKVTEEKKKRFINITISNIYNCFSNWSELRLTYKEYHRW